MKVNISVRGFCLLLPMKMNKKKSLSFFHQNLFDSNGINIGFCRQLRRGNLVGLKTHSDSWLNKTFSVESREGVRACRDRNGDGNRGSSSLTSF